MLGHHCIKPSCLPCTPSLSCNTACVPRPAVTAVLPLVGGASSGPTAAFLYFWIALAATYIPGQHMGLVSVATPRASASAAGRAPALHTLLVQVFLCLSLTSLYCYAVLAWDREVPRGGPVYSMLRLLA